MWLAVLAILSLVGWKLFPPPKKQRRFPVVGVFDSTPLYGGSKGGVGYIEVEFVPMCDWDTPDQHHPEQCLTFKSKVEVLLHVQQWIAAHPGVVIRLYDTPGGLRGWILSHRMDPSEMRQWWAELLVDPLYQKFCLRRGAFACRVTRKPREGDYVAFPLCTLGEGDVLPLNQELVRWHDQLISQ